MRRCFATPRRTRLCITVLALALTCGPAAGAAQKVTVSELKAAFLHNFARFTEWPVDVMSPGADLVICVIGDTAVGDALVRTSDGQDINGHRIVVARGKIENVATCHVMYVSGLDAKRSSALVGSVKGLSVLTVSDSDEFTQLGGVARFFVEHGKLRFAFNVDTLLRARIYVSSQLLSLAIIEKDDPHAGGR